MFRLIKIAELIKFSRQCAAFYTQVNRTICYSSGKKRNSAVGSLQTLSKVETILCRFNGVKDESIQERGIAGHKRLSLIVRHQSGNCTNNVGKESTISKVKRLFVSYWYIVIPVYIFLDVIFAFLFYLLLESGFDLVGIMKLFDVNDQSIEKVEKKTTTPAGRIALVFILLKIVAPVRYALTLALSTLAIRFLSKRSYVQKKGMMSKIFDKCHMKKQQIKKNKK